jgi:hypothetical protein
MIVGGIREQHHHGEVSMIAIQDDSHYILLEAIKLGMLDGIGEVIHIGDTEIFINIL